MINIHQADGINIEHRRGIGIVAHFRWIAGDADKVPDSHRRRSQQIALDAQYVSVTARVVQDRLHAHFLLDQERERLVADARGRPRTIGDVDPVHSHGLKESRPFDFLVNIDSLRGDNFHHGDELTASELCAQRRAFFQAKCGNRLGRGRRSNDTRGSNFSSCFTHTQGRFHDPDVFLSCSTTTAHDPRPCRHKLSRITRHVFGRTQINVPAVDRTGNACVRLS